MPTPPSTTSCVVRFDNGGDPLVLVEGYVDDSRDRLDARQFAVIFLSGDVQAVRDEGHGWDRDPTVSAWKKCSDIGAIALCQN